jgi:hypothetical protein
MSHLLAFLKLKEWSKNLNDYVLYVPKIGNCLGRPDNFIIIETIK